MDIARYHVEWVRYVIKNSLNLSQKSNPEDFVQDAYIKLLNLDSFNPIKYYQADGKINRKYFFLTLKSLIIDDYKKKKLQTIYLNPNIDQPEEQSVNNHNQMEVVFDKIEKTISNMYWFDKKMLNLYMYRLPSIRKLSKATDINSKVVFETLKRCKLIIKKQLICHYQTQEV